MIRFRSLGRRLFGQFPSVPIDANGFPNPLDRPLPMALMVPGQAHRRKVAFTTQNAPYFLSPVAGELSYAHVRPILENDSPNRNPGYEPQATVLYRGDLFACAGDDGVLPRDCWLAELVDDEDRPARDLFDFLVSTYTALPVDPAPPRRVLEVNPRRRATLFMIFTTGGGELHLVPNATEPAKRFPLPFLGNSLFIAEGPTEECAALVVGGGTHTLFVVEYF